MAGSRKLGVAGLEPEIQDMNNSSINSRGSSRPGPIGLNEGNSSGPVLNVFLADLPNSVDYPAPIRRYLQNALEQTVDKYKLDVSIRVKWSSSRPTIRKRDLLVYFVDNSDDSVIHTGLGSSRKKGGPGAQGWTFFSHNGLVGSEVYLDGYRGRSDGGALGRIALHELMHNMSRTGDAMHKPGMAVGAETTASDAVLSDSDMKFIANHLTKTARTQWAEGYTHYHDPARKMSQ